MCEFTAVLSNAPVMILLKEHYIFLVSRILNFVRHLRHLEVISIGRQRAIIAMLLP